MTRDAHHSHCPRFAGRHRFGICRRNHPKPGPGRPSRTLMKAVKAVVFDLGKVLVDFDYGIAGRKLAARATMAAAELGRFLVHVPLIVEYETGLLSSQQFYERVRAASGF